MSSTEALKGADARRLVRACFESLGAAADLLRAQPELLNARDGLGETALHYLAVENQLAAVQWLFSRGAALDTVSDVHGSPLSEACSLGYEELVDWLLDHGATLDLPGQGEPTLNEAARSGKPTIVARVIAAGADIAATNALGETALHVACEDDARLAVVELLLGAGASLASTRVFDETPLDVAIRAGAHRVEALLRARGANTGRFAA